MKFPDRVMLSVTGSTAALTLGAAVFPYRTLAAAIAAGDVAVGNRVSVCVEDAAGNWEESYYTVDSGAQLTRESVYRSSGSAVTFPATAFCTVFGKDLVVTRDIAFSTSIPLTHPGAAYMAQQSVTGALAFTPMAGAVRGALVYLRLVANGTNAPTFTGFKEWGGSLGYDNRAGIVNQLQFFYDGFDYWYSVSQAVGVVPADVVAPTASSAAVANATPSTVAIAMSEALDAAYVPAASAFTVSGHTVLSVAISSSTLSLSVSPAFVNGEAARTVAYTQPGTNNARDAAGNLLANFTGLAVTNNVQAVDSTAPAFSSAAVANATPTQIAITMNETLANSVPAANAFAVSGGKTVSSIAVAGAVVTLTVSSAYVNGDAITVSYTQPGVDPRLQDAAGNATASFGPVSVTNNVAAVGDATPPTLSSPTATKTGASTATGSISTNEANGTLYYLVSTSATATVAAVKAGANQAVSATGVQNVALTGLTAATTYYLHFLQRDAAGNDSAVSTSGSFITDAAPAASANNTLVALTTGVTSDGLDPATYTASGVGTNYNSGAGGTLSKHFDANTDGEFMYKPNGTAMGVQLWPTSTYSTSGAQFMFNSPYGTGYAYDFGGVTPTGTAGTFNSTLKAAVVDIVKFRRENSSGGGNTATLIVSVSKDSGATWTEIVRITSAPAGAQYVRFLAKNGSQMTPLTSTGMVA